MEWGLFRLRRAPVGWRAVCVGLPGERRNNPHSQIAAGGGQFTQKFIYRWDGGFSGFAAVVEAAGNAYVWAYRASDGIVCIHQINAGGAGFTQKFMDKWDTGFSAFAGVSVEGVPYIRAYRASDGIVCIHQIDAGGAGFTQKLMYKWDTGFSGFAAVADASGNGYVWAYRASDGIVCIHQINAGGAGFTQRFMYKWDTGFSGFGLHATLHAGTEQRFVVRRRDPVTRRFARHTYSLDDAGRRLLRTSLTARGGLALAGASRRNLETNKYLSIAVVSLWNPAKPLRTTFSCPRSAAIPLPVAASHARAVLSLEAVATRITGTYALHERAAELGLYGITDHRITVARACATRSSGIRAGAGGFAKCAGSCNGRPLSLGIPLDHAAKTFLGRAWRWNHTSLEKFGKKAWKPRDRGAFPSARVRKVEP
jgi:hypothetical protein